MNKQLLSGLLLWLGLASLALAATDNSNQPSYSYLNAQRQLAGMTPLAIAPPLAKSSYNHAVYLDQVKELSHYQTQKNSKLFTGNAPKDRAFYAGWQFSRVLENFTFGETNAFKSIDGLFTSIYHRIAFLDFYTDTLGAALVGKAYVFNLSNAKLNALCSQTSEGNIYGVCRQQKKLIDKDAYDLAQINQAKANPWVVVWPPKQAQDVVPVFYEEIPEPLPSHLVSGNPISVHFNPYYFPDAQAIQLNKFTLLEGCLTPVKIIHLNKHNDPNKLLSDRDFVFFPDERLKFNTQYCVEAEFSINKQKWGQAWNFTTANPGSNLITMKKNQTQLQLKITKNQPLYIYFEPTSPQDSGKQVSYSYPKGVEVKTQFYDSNTLLVELASSLEKGQVELNFSGRKVTLSF